MDSRYLQELNDAISLAKKLKMPDLQWDSIELRHQDLDELQKITDEYIGEIAKYFTKILRTDYLGNSCLDISAITFMYLRAKGLNPEMIFGNVNINNSPDNEWDATKESIQEEYKKKINDGPQNIHAWIGLGGNIIIDFALPHRLWKNYKGSEDFCMPIGYAGTFEQYNIKYMPILTGSDFFKQTNAYDPLLDELFNFKNRVKAIKL